MTPAFKLIIDKTREFLEAASDEVLSSTYLYTLEVTNENLPEDHTKKQNILDLIEHAKITPSNELAIEFKNITYAMIEADPPMAERIVIEHCKMVTLLVMDFEKRNQRS